MADQSALFDVVLEFARRAPGAFTVDGVMRGLVDATGRIVPVEGAGVMCLDGGRLRFAHASSSGASTAEAAQDLLEQGPCHDAVRLGETVLEPDLSAGAWRWPDFAERALRAGMGSVAAVPLLARGRAWGTLDLYRSEPAPWAREDLRAAQTLADVAASYLVMATDRDVAEAAKDALVHAATHDVLTGLPNRAALMRHLERELARTRGHGGGIGLAFLDLDGFKGVNDVHGHEEGDALLVALAGRLRAAVRAEDLVARLAGDEFCVVLDGMAGRPQATEVADVLRGRVEGGLLPRGVGVSLVLALAPDDGTDPGALLHAADVAMYADKAARARSAVRPGE